LNPALRHIELTDCARQRGAIAFFSGKAIIVKLAIGTASMPSPSSCTGCCSRCRSSWHCPGGGRDKPPLSGADLRLLSGLGFSGYYLASFLDFSGLQYISANLERLILYLNPTFVLAIGALLFHTPVTASNALRCW